MCFHDSILLGDVFNDLRWSREKTPIMGSPVMVPKRFVSSVLVLCSTPLRQNPGAKLNFFSFASQTVKTAYTSVLTAQHCSSTHAHIHMIYHDFKMSCLKPCIQTGIMGLYDGLGAGIWRQVRTGMQHNVLLLSTRFLRLFRPFLADFLCKQQIWTVAISVHEFCIMGPATAIACYSLVGNLWRDSGCFEVPSLTGHSGKVS